jgi:alkylation response protein AidB-like acyl-CoA dehydrogenase
LPDRIPRICAAATADGYHLTGVKHFISNGGVADFIVVFAVTDPAARHKGRVADLALQIHGGYGYGYVGDLPLERYVRELRIMRIYEGLSEIQRTVTARALTRAPD